MGLYSASWEARSDERRRTVHARIPVAGFLTHLFKQVSLVLRLQAAACRPVGNRGAAGKDDRSPWHRLLELTTTPPLHLTQLDWRTISAMDDCGWLLLRRQVTICELSGGSTTCTPITATVTSTSLKSRRVCLQAYAQQIWLSEVVYV
jgi:hypothetical protein